MNFIAVVYELALFTAVLAAVSYAGLGVLAWRRNRESHARTVPTWQHAALIATAALHTAVLVVVMWLWALSGSLRLGFAQALSLTACVGVWLFIIESRWLAIEGLRPLALSLPAVSVALGAWVAPSLSLKLDAIGVLHVLTAIAAHGVALLAAGHALLLLALTRMLRTHGEAQSNWALTLTRHSPPLVVLERVLIRLAAWTAGLLAITVALGAWGGHLKFDHKTVLTVASLIAWLTVRWGYERRAWRGAGLCASVWVATGLLMLAYIGSRFVLQAILQRV